MAKKRTQENYVTIALNGKLCAAVFQAKKNRDEDPLALITDNESIQDFCRRLIAMGLKAYAAQRDA